MPRLLFEKTGNAIWISHLDLMRVFQRAFKRAGLPLTHTQGYNPRPSVSIALPLSVGVESKCELLDFQLDGIDISNDMVMERLNRTLVAGVNVLQVYGNGRKLRELSLLRSKLIMEYDSGVPVGAVSALRDLFNSPALIVEKKTKNGVQEQDIIPMLRSLEIEQTGQKEIVLTVLACCQNPTLNPTQLPLAVEKYLPHFKSDFSRCMRVEIFDDQQNVFR